MIRHLLKGLLVIILIQCLYDHSHAQFLGGNNDGFSHAKFIASPSPTAMATFGGGNNDGFASAKYTATVPPAVMATFGGGSNDGFGFDVTNEGTLPITLRSFTGVCQDGVSGLEWITETEIDNEYFIISKSYDGVNWVPIGTVMGVGSSSETHRYRFSEKVSMPDVLSTKSPFLLYYDLHSKDYDGTIHHGKTILVQCTSSAALTVFPNPTQGTVTVSGLAGGRIEYSVFNDAGTLVHQGSKDLAGSEPLVEISLENFTPGLYLIVLSNDFMKQSFMVLKQ